MRPMRKRRRGVILVMSSEVETSLTVGEQTVSKDKKDK